MIDNPIRELLFAVIKQAVHDRRSAVSRGLLDDKANPVPIKELGRKIRNERHGVTCSLNYFFYHGGLDFLMTVTKLDHDPEKIKKISGEPYGE